MKRRQLYILRPARVWELLTIDPATYYPGCERLEQIGDELYAADIKLGLAGVRGDYSGTVRISISNRPEKAL